MKALREEGKGVRRLLVILCTLLLAGSVLLVLGVTVWAQEAPEEQPAEEQPAEEQPAETTGEEAAQQQPAQEETQDGLVIDYWEPQVGTRTVYHINDFMNDLHGNTYGTSALGYWDDYELWISTVFNLVPYPPSYWMPNFASSHYRTVSAISDMNPIYFDLEGPWYLNMTTPWKCVQEVVGIHEAPDAGQFPYATYAIKELFICSGGHRALLYHYMSNDPDMKTWDSWGHTYEYIPERATTPVKEVVPYSSPHDPGLRACYTVMSFPISVGKTGSVDAVSRSGSVVDERTSSSTFEVLAEGQISVPGGTYEALLVKYSSLESFEGVSLTRIIYRWMAKDVGVVAEGYSLPDILGPTFGETANSIEGSSYFVNAPSMQVLESFAVPAGGQQ